MPLSDTHYQGFAQRCVQQAVTRDRVPHAFFFHGPEGVGKELFSRGLAQRLLCGSPKKRACNEKSVGIRELWEGCGACDDCRWVEAGTHPDFHLIDRRLHRDHPDPLVQKRSGRELTVDVVRHFVIDKVALTPHRGRAKVFVIRGADEMTTQAQNALLKTLEEPPGTTFLILLASAIDYLLPTTLSRCQEVRFDGLPESFVRDRLGAMCANATADELTWCAKFGEGSLGQSKEAVAFGIFSMAQELDVRLAELHQIEPGVLVKFWSEAGKVLGERYAKDDEEMTEAEGTRRGTITMLRLTATALAARLRSSVGDEPFAEATAAAINRTAATVSHIEANVNTQLALEALANELTGRALV